MIHPFSKFALKKLKFLPRYQRGIINLKQYTVEYIDPLSSYYEYKDIFEKKIYHFYTNKKKPIIIDAGGYIGLSVLYFKSIYPQSQIIVFEPDSNIYRILNKNINNNNNLNNITSINAGLGKKNKIAKFYPDNADGGTMFNGDNMEATKIKIVKLSTYINKPIDLLKMNIEGSEGEVLKEIEDKLHFVKEIIFEYHAFDNLPQNLGKILTILDKNSFRYLITNAVGKQITIPFHLSKKYCYFNLIYAKQI